MTGPAGSASADTAEPIAEGETSAPTPAAGGFGPYRNRYWTFTSPVTGSVRMDVLLSTNAATPGYLPLDVVMWSDVDGYHYPVERDPDWQNNVYVVNAGETYGVWCESWDQQESLTYVLRIGEVVPGETVQFGPVDRTGEFGASTRGGGQTFGESFNGPHPGTDPAAIECAWKHARRHQDPPGLIWWSPDNSSLGDGVSGHCPSFWYEDYRSYSDDGLVGWDYGVAPHEIFIGGTMTMHVYAPIASFRPADDLPSVSLTGDPDVYLVTIQDAYGDDVVGYLDPHPEQPQAPATSFEVGAFETEWASGPGGPASWKWKTGPVRDGSRNAAEMLDATGVIPAGGWVEVDPTAEEFNAMGFNDDTGTDVTPTGITLTAGSYGVSRYRDGQHLRWRATLAPRPFLIFRRPPPIPASPDEDYDPVRLWPRDDAYGPMGSSERLYPPPRVGRVVGQQQ